MKKKREIKKTHEATPTGRPTTSQPPFICFTLSHHADPRRPTARYTFLTYALPSLAMVGASAAASVDRRPRDTRTSGLVVRFSVME